MTPPAPITWLPGSTAIATSAGDRQDEAVDLPLNLETILSLAGQRPLEIALARAKAAEAMARESLAESRWLPTLNPRIAMVRHEDRLQDTVGNLLDVDKQNAFGGAGVGVLFNPARAYYDTLIAAQHRRAAELGIQSVQHVNVETAVRMYYDLVQDVAGLQIAEQTERQATELVKVQQAARTAGRGLEADVLRAKAFLASAKGRVARAGAAVQQANARLAGLLVLPDQSQLIPTEQAVVPIDFGEAELEIKVLLDRATSNRPDLQQARSMIAAADGERAREAWSWLLPELHLGADYGTYGATLSRASKREDYFADLQWRVDFGTPARARAADARHMQAELRMQTSLLKLRTDLRVAVAEVRATNSQITAAREEIAAATAALDLVKLRNREGR
ncbi:MAG: TolC family protein, partial [Planctomycetota bacterium]|nr:TolC family protein [Planctomycetota bacterium]